MYGAVKETFIKVKKPQKKQIECIIVDGWTGKT